MYSSLHIRAYIWLAQQRISILISASNLANPTDIRLTHKANAYNCAKVAQWLNMHSSKESLLT
jgi:hypothetical protein